MKITCSILTYNEAKRIRNALGHALKWADEVLVLDKSSTDGTPDIARDLGARVHTMPFSKQGHEDYIHMYAQSAHDWTWVFTPGEIPMRSVVTAAREAIAKDDCDVLAIRLKYWSFGIHNANSPWSWSYQPRLFHRRRAVISNVVHNQVGFHPGRIKMCGGDGFVLHQTHATVGGFLSSHVEYMQAELASGTPDEIIARAARNAESFTGQFRAHPELLPHQLAWRIYWQGVALHAWEKKMNQSVPDQYQARADEFLRTEWA